MATRFATKEAAAAAIEQFSIPCAGPVAIVAIAAKVVGVQAGWYIGFPPSISKKLVDVSEYAGV